MLDFSATPTSCQHRSISYSYVHRAPELTVLHTSIAMAGVGCAGGASAARSFFQIANRGYSTATATSCAPLEFLLPQTVSRADCHAAFLLRSCKTTGAGRTGRVPWRKTPFGGPARLSPQTRAFTATASRRATMCVLNPRTDEDGKEMMLEITPRAAKVWQLLLDLPKGAWANRSVL
ncbi:uncharacterized protein MAM_06264 [Metarhizium album ARSEF 1941]|uniref:Uncharacterized protein n=1 Tax=Metarhizium album (strain ARSEF 1941) TaxID=1081103 RepID=A0A0B2WQY0_METAS|nr:uncharacterized protein MAM_06264 [Metarhizium album ARSEF 1941]KHN95902.1 hypothetical protein MAM_06264 [Metarhizium album ARSEF 1941]